MLSQVRSEQRNWTEVDKRIDELDMRVNGQLLSAFQKTQQDVHQLLEKSNQREVALLTIDLHL